MRGDQRINNWCIHHFNLLHGFQKVWSTFLPPNSHDFSWTSYADPQRSSRIFFFVFSISNPLYVIFYIFLTSKKNVQWYTIQRTNGSTGKSDSSLVCTPSTVIRSKSNVVRVKKKWTRQAKSFFPRYDILFSSPCTCTYLNFFSSTIKKKLYLFPSFLKP